MSCTFAKQLLPQFGFDKKQVDRVCELILETKVPHNPQSQLAKILCDADMAHIGGKRYQNISQRLFNELRNLNVDVNADIWVERQIEFLENQQFWTEYAQKKYQANKYLVLKNLKHKLVQAG